MQLLTKKFAPTELLDSQKVELFEHIMQNGYNPADFEYKVFTCKIGKSSNDNGYELNEIRYKPDDNFSFGVHVFLNNFSIRCTPHLRSLSHSTVVQDWKSVLTLLKTWLYAINRETEAKSVWESILTGAWNNKICIPGGEFTLNEKTYLQRKLTEIISEVSSDSRFDDCLKSKFIKELEHSRAFADTAPRKSDWFAALLFHLYMNLGCNERYRIVQNYVNQLLIAYGKEFNMLVNKFMSRFSATGRNGISLEF